LTEISLLLFRDLESEYREGKKTAEEDINAGQLEAYTVIIKIGS
jgi:hypothetical protein